jgi:hypothetical protein
LGKCTPHFRGCPAKFSEECPRNIKRAAERGQRLEIKTVFCDDIIAMRINEIGGTTNFSVVNIITKKVPAAIS